MRASAPWKHWPKDHRLTGQPALSLHRRREIAAAAAARRRQGLAACRPRHVCLTLPAHTVREPSIASPRANPTGARETPMRAGPRLAGHRRCFFHSGDPKVVWSLRSLAINRGELTVEACYCHALLREDTAQLCRRPCCQAWALMQATCSDLLHVLRLRFSSSTAPPATYLCERAALCSPPRRRFFQPGTPPSGRRPQRDVSKHRKYTCSGSRPRGMHFDRYRGVRVGEASTPGPPRLHDQQERALEALARVGIGPAHNGGVAHIASESFFDCEPPDNLVRSADDQSDHTAPGMTPPPSEDDTPGAADRQAVCEATLLDTPPETARSWLYVPLLLHAAGRLTDHAAQVWLAHPSGGARWRRAAESLAAAPPVALSELVAAVHAVGLAEGSTDVDVACICSRLGILASSAIPLRDAVAVMATDGDYIPALAQSALLQTYCSTTLTNDIVALADVFRPGGSPSPSRPPARAAGLSAPALDADADEVVLAAAAEAAAGRAVGRGRRARGNGRGRRRTRVQPAADAMTGVDTSALGPPAPVAPPQPTPSAAAFASDLSTELKRRVYTLQSAPPQFSKLDMLCLRQESCADTLFLSAGVAESDALLKRVRQTNALRA